MISANMYGMMTLDQQCIFKCDPDGALTFANESLCTLYGASMDELEGFGYLNFIRHDLRAARKEDWQAEIKHSKRVTSSFTLIHGITGEEIKVTYTAAIKRDEKDKIISIFGIVTKLENQQ
jgi:PAS domain S-box-containing protein